MNLIPVKTPKVFRRLYPDYLWRVATEEKVLYLTFDDGPTPEVSEFVLETLDSFDAKATFFCIGQNIEKYPSLFQTILKQGHAVGNHTHRHVKGWKTSTEDYLRETALCLDMMQKHSDGTSMPNLKLFRPPYGKLTQTQGKALLERGYQIVMWDILSFDWKASIPEEDCLNNVLDHSKEGSIIVFHDSQKANKNMSYALPKVLAHFSERGYQFKNLATK